MIEIIPTNTCPASFAELRQRSELFAGFSKQVQLDIDDGVFAPELSWPYLGEQWAELEAMAVSGKKLPCVDALAYEAHLMVEEPTRIGELLARVGCTRVIAHVEVFEGEISAREAFALWKAAGALEVGLAALIDTPLSALEPYVADCNVVQFMSIARLGKQGASFEPRIIARIAEFRERFPDTLISVDGGVSETNIQELVRAGARRFGVGSAITKAADPKAAYENLKTIAESALQ